MSDYIGTTQKTEINRNDHRSRTFWDMFFIAIFDWRAIFFILLTITLLSAIGIKKVYEYMKSTTKYNDYCLESVSFFGHLFILNCFIAIFTICYYFFKRGMEGKKGPRGKYGATGPQGVNKTCDICSLKVNTMKRDEFIDEDEDIEVDTSLFESESQIKTKKWMSYNLNNKFVLGKGTLCKKCKVIKYPYINYIKGIIANTNDDGIIDSLQYLYDQNGKTKLLGKKEGVLGSTNKNNVSKIKCPKNCGIFKMDVGYDNSKDGISGVKIYCRDYQDGTVKLPTKTTLGKIEQFHQTKTAFCPNNNALLSGLNGYHNGKQPVNMTFSQCNYYE